MYLVWDGFVSAKIQQWEQFYIKWIEEGKNVLVVVYEQLKTRLLRKSLGDISKFLNFTINGHRLQCTILQSEGIFHRKEKCIEAKFRGSRNIDGTKMNKAGTEYLIFENENQSLTKDIFSSDNRLKIDAAIDNVNQAIINRGLNSLPVDEYRNTTIKLRLCD